MSKQTETEFVMRFVLPHHPILSTKILMSAMIEEFSKFMVVKSIEPVENMNKPHEQNLASN